MRTRRNTAIALLALTAATAAATRSPAAAPARTSLPGEPAGWFAAQVLRLEVAGRWEEQYRLLNPGHQQLITERQYVICSRPLGTAIGPERFVVRDTRLVPIHVPHVAARTAALVTIEMHRPGSTQAATFHVHAVADRGRWTWILGKQFLRALDGGRCLDGAPLASAPPL
jgi:hypothetical protein